MTVSIKLRKIFLQNSTYFINHVYSSLEENISQIIKTTFKPIRKLKKSIAITMFKYRNTNQYFISNINSEIVFN